MAGDHAVRDASTPRADIRVTVVDAQAPHQVCEVALVLPASSTVEAALRAAGAAMSSLAGMQEAHGADTLQVGVWGRRVGLQHVLRDHDRVELYRALRVDPKVARRERFAKQGAGRTGLFAKRRPGAKAGY
jgi:putative ubiquitin-RnfH superfamily antitoxin RatB of RatAB toxin-antitoxin module